MRDKDNFNFKTTNIFQLILNILHIKYTKSFTNKFVDDNPNRNNLFGLSKMLLYYGIDNTAYKVSSQTDSIREINTPFVAQFGDGLVTVYKVSDDRVYFIWNSEKHSSSMIDFCSQWTGITLLLDSNDKSIEPNFNENFKKEFSRKLIYYLFYISIAIFSIVEILGNKLYFNHGYFALLFVNLFGLYLGYLLMQKRLHIEDNFADKICGFLKSDCNKYIDKNITKFIENVSWSELGFSYFLANVIIIISIPHFVQYMSVINICVLPFSFWSIWYQKFKAKSWCSLCLLFILLLWLVFLTDLLYGKITFDNWLMQGFCLTLCIYIFSLCLTIIQASDKYKIKTNSTLYFKYNQLKMDDSIFPFIFDRQSKYHVNKKSSSILLGNDKSNNIVTIITNPHCEPCFRMHERVEKLLLGINNDFCIQLIFTSFNKDLEESNKFLIGAYILYFDKFGEVLNKWYKDYRFHPNTILNDYNINVEDPVIQDEFLKHKEWSMYSKISGTPTILVNGYLLPSILEIEDVFYFDWKSIPK